MNMHLELQPITLSGQVLVEHEFEKKSLVMDAATDLAQLILHELPLA